MPTARETLFEFYEHDHETIIWNQLGCLNSQYCLKSQLY